MKIGMGGGVSRIRRHESGSSGAATDTSRRRFDYVTAVAQAYIIRMFVYIFICIIPPCEDHMAYLSSDRVGLVCK